MRKLLLLSLVTTWSLGASASTVTSKFLDALEHIESRGDASAAGDKKNGVYRAVGSFQIWKIYVRETNRLLRLPVFSYSDRLDRAASRYMTKVVLSYWSRFHGRKGRHIGYAELASLHRCPNASWRPSRMNTEHERNRTRKLLEYMK